MIIIHKISKIASEISEFIGNWNMKLAGYIASRSTTSMLTFGVIQKSLALTITALMFTSIIIAATISISESIEMKNKIKTMGNRISHELSLPLWNLDQGMLDTLLAIEINDPDVARIEIFDISGALYKGVSRDAAGDFFFYSSKHSRSDEKPIFGKQIDIKFTLNERDFGYGQITFSYWGAFMRMIISTAIFIILFLALTIILFLILQKAIQKKIITPVLHLSEVVFSYSQNNFANRSMIQSRDELGVLAGTINQMADKIEKYNRRLEQMVEDRTKQLINAEKMAALGELVAGISHEINTPIGTALTAASFLEKKATMLSMQLSTGDIRKSDLDSSLRNIDDAMKLVITNLTRASELIQSFKKVAVDRSSSDKRIFNIKEYLKDIATSLKPRLKKNAHVIEIEADEMLEIESYPGDLSQVITNLIINSIVHGFDENKKSGLIKIRAVKENGNLMIIYSDDGVGIPEENISKIFNPFFTTKRGTGGSGLGLNIVYNIVTQKLGGTIECRSTVGIGTTFTLTLPLQQ
jgi:signal transduction histidine kinase